MNKITLDLNKVPWKQVLWNDYEKVMLPKADKLVSNLLMYMYDSTLLTAASIDNLIKSYSTKLNMNEEEILEVIEDIKDTSQKNN